MQVNLAALQRSRWYEYLERFVFGGTVTVLAGLIARKYGAGVGGLFLAFPAIFPATATMLESHERQKEPSRLRARQVAGIDAAGAAMGSIGLAAFALAVVIGLPRHSLAAVLAAASMLWLLVAVAAWWVRKAGMRKLRLAWRRHTAAMRTEAR